MEKSSVDVLEQLAVARARPTEGNLLSLLCASLVLEAAIDQALEDGSCLLIEPPRTK